MRGKIYLIGLAAWLAFCVVAPAYDASTLAERSAHSARIAQVERWNQEMRDWVAAKEWVENALAELDAE